MSHKVYSLQFSRVCDSITNQSKQGGGAHLVEYQINDQNPARDILLRAGVRLNFLT